MTDLITIDRAFFIEGRASSKTRPAGILSILFVIAATVLIYLLAKDAASAAPIVVEYTVIGDRSAENLGVPSLRIVYGFPKSMVSNIEGIINIEGVESEVALNDYPDADWDEHFGTDKDPDLVYKYQDWPTKTSFTRIKEKVVSNPTGVTPTDWYCIDTTEIATPLRLNEYGDIECLSTDALNCHWNEFTKADCLAEVAKYEAELNPLSCGIQHFVLWDMTGYDSPSHWCTTSRAILKAIENKSYDTWDNTLAGKKIFVAVEEYRFNMDTRKIQKTNKVWSSTSSPKNYVNTLSRSISDAHVFQGFYKGQSEVLYNHYTSDKAEFIRPLPQGELFHFDVVEPEEMLLNSNVKEYRYDLTLDIIAEIASMVELVYGVLAIANDIFDDFIMSSMLYAYIYLSKDSRIYDSVKKEQKKQKLISIKQAEYSHFTFINFVKVKFLGFLFKKNPNLNKLKANLEEIEQISSMEGFLLTDEMKEEEVPLIERVLMKFDLFASKQNFYVGSKKRFRHTIGKLLTVIYIIIIPVAFFVVGTDFVYRQFPLKTVVPNDLSPDADLTDFYTSVPMILSYPKEIEPVNFQLFDIPTSQWNNFKKSPGDCSIEQIAKFNIIALNSMTYKCFDLTYLAGESTKTTEITFGIESCIKKGTCTVSDVSYEFGVKLWNYDLNSKEGQYAEQIAKTVITDGTNPIWTQTLQFIDWTEDGNVAVSDWANMHIFPYDDGTALAFDADDDNFFSTTDLTFQLTLSTETTVVTRQFPKFIITFKKTMYAVFAVFLLLYIINSAFSDYFYLLIFKGMFFKDSQHQDKEKDFTLKNHIFYLFNCCPQRKNDNYKVVHDKMRESLDIKYVFQRTPEKNQGDDELGELKSKDALMDNSIKPNQADQEKFKFLKNIDILPDNTKPFKINGDDSLKTTIGGVFSLLCLAGFGVLSYFTLIDFWYRTNPTVSQNNLNFGESDLSFWVSPKSIAMIYYSTADNYSASFVLNSVAAERLFELDPDTCTDAHFKELEVTKQEGYSYACLDIFETLGKVDTIGNPSKRFFALSITSCPVWRDFKHNLYVGNGNYSFELDECNSTDYDAIGIGKTVEVGFAAKFWQFDKNSPDLIKQIINYNETNSDGDMMFSEVRMKENQLNDDVGMITSDIQTSLFASSGGSSKVIKQGWDTGTFGRLYVAFHEDTAYYTQKQRTYQKIADLAVTTTGYFSLLTAGCQIFLNLFVDYLFIKHLFKYFTKSTQDLQKATTFIGKGSASLNKGSTSLNNKASVFSTRKSTYLETSGGKKEKELKISLFNFLKWKTCQCFGATGPYESIINYASYERLYQNAMSNKIKLKLPKTLQEEVDEGVEEGETPQIEMSSSYMFSPKKMQIKDGETPSFMLSPKRPGEVDSARIELSSSLMFSPKRPDKSEAYLDEIKESKEP